MMRATLCRISCRGLPSSSMLASGETPVGLFVYVWIEVVRIASSKALAVLAMYILTSNALAVLAIGTNVSNIVQVCLCAAHSGGCKTNCMR